MARIEEIGEKIVQGVAIVKLVDGYTYRQTFSYPIEHCVGRLVFKNIKEGETEYVQLVYDYGPSSGSEPIFWAQMKEITWYGIVMSFDGSSSISKEC